MQEKRSMGRDYCRNLAIEIWDAADGRPQWAKEET